MNNYEQPVFEQLYMQVRRKEKRIYDTEALTRLPETPANHIHKKEWLIRKASSDRFIRYLQKKEGHVRLLEVGCGNGWLSHRIAASLGAEVTGLDINRPELEEAREIWKDQDNLKFIFGDIRNGIFPAPGFDIILFAASIQYFPSLPEIIGSAKRLLNKDGEIHILDTKFYGESEISKAADRTRSYYHALGYPDMAALYHHHSWQSLQAFRYRLLFRPGAFMQRLRGNKNLFPWIMIGHQ